MRNVTTRSSPLGAAISPTVIQELHRVNRNATVDRAYESVSGSGIPAEAYGRPIRRVRRARVSKAVSIGPQGDRRAEDRLTRGWGLLEHLADLPMRPRAAGLPIRPALR